jgi:hypothetical protein
MVAANRVAKEKRLDENNVFQVDGNLKLLKSAAIYGANASGKSNFAKAINFMKRFIVNSSKETQITEKIDVEPFKLSTETENKPSYFEIIFLLHGQKYRYGFEANQERIISEWLFYVPNIRETKLFRRKYDEIELSERYKADGIQQRTRRNALFLSVSAQFNVEIATSILNWIINQLKIISGLKDDGHEAYTFNCLMEDIDKKTAIFNLIKKLDLGISKLEVKTGGQGSFLERIKDFPDAVKKILIEELEHELNDAEVKIVSIKSLHQKFDKNGILIGIEPFDLSFHESEGTQKIFAISGPLVDCLQEGKTLIIDEFDARLHPLISYAIVELFNSTKTNPSNAQLVLMTHDTSLLSNKLFRRDQIWFVEKTRFGVTDLYSLAEYKVRNDASFERDYIKGRYGAIPYIGDLSNFLDAYA